MSVKNHLHFNPSPEAQIAVTEGVLCNNEAIRLQRLGDFKGAERLHLLALELKLRGLGDNHITTALSRNALGELYIKMGKLDEAEMHLLRAVEVRNTAGRDDFEAAISRENLAQVHEVKGNLLEAKKIRRSTGRFACSHYHCPGQIYNRTQLRQCGKCASIYYCSEACQKANWRRHKSYCNAVKN